MRQRPTLLWLTGIVVFALVAGSYVYSQWWVDHYVPGTANIEGYAATDHPNQLTVFFTTGWGDIVEQPRVFQDSKTMVKITIPTRVFVPGRNGFKNLSATLARTTVTLDAPLERRVVLNGTTDVPIPAATSGPTASTPPTDTPPPLNRLEVKVVDALGRLGVNGMRAQLAFNNANIWADFGSAGQLFVNAWPQGTPRGESTVVDERQLAGVRVQRVQTPSGPQLIYRFECSGDTTRSADRPHLASRTWMRSSQASSARLVAEPDRCAPPSLRPAIRLADIRRPLIRRPHI